MQLSRSSLAINKCHPFLLLLGFLEVYQRKQDNETTLGVPEAKSECCTLAISHSRDRKGSSADSTSLVQRQTSKVPIAPK